MKTPIENMRCELVRDRLRRAYREAMNTLIAGGIDERDAETVTYEALWRLIAEVQVKRQEEA